MEEMGALLVRWRLDEAAVRRRMYRAPTPRERERWHAVWLLTQGWTAAGVGRALERDAHTILGGPGGDLCRFPHRGNCRPLESLRLHWGAMDTTIIGVVFQGH